MKPAAYHADYWLSYGDNTPEIERLVSRLRAVSNFVQILTGNTDIKVVYSEKDKSYTDGETIVISTANDNPDVTVGLALHESSHILYTNFEFVRSIEQAAADIKRTMHGNFKDTYPSIIPMKYSLEMESHKVTPITALHYLTLILNIIEDRRIDANTYQAAPGYRPYYDALYQQYLYGRKNINDDIVSGKIAADKNIESYIEYLIHIANPILDIDSLDAFRDIVTLVDLENIQRFNTDARMKRWKSDKSEMSPKTIPDIWELCLDIFSIIIKHANIENLAFEDTMFGENHNVGDGTLSDGQWEEREFILGRVEKEECSPILKDIIESTLTAEASFLQLKANDRTTTSITVFNRLHDGLVCLRESRYRNTKLWHSGLAMGRKLLHSLRIRIYDDHTTLPRYKTGRIDKRLLAQAGIGIDTIFNRFINEPHRPILIHYTIDASSSMDGTKFENAVRLAIALAFVSKNLRNVHFVASMRNSPGRSVHVFKLFDSNIHNMSYAEEFMPRLRTSGGTPEGLGIYPMLAGMIASKESRKILVNISDGMPSHGVQYTAQIINEFRMAGIDIVSYYVSDWEEEYSKNIMKDFRYMYGVDSEFINVQDFQQIAKTINKRLLEK